MAVYLINSYNIHDFEAFKKYLPLLKTLLDKYGAEVLASDLKAISLEGKAKTMNAIIRFPSKEAVFNCYNDPEYTEIKKSRLKATSDCDMIVVNEFVPLPVYC
ncbi:DUF1330 domain-containing protein [Rhodocytophaga aerolata]|uniref:DUF1330 domain-containing protein n=1 Tax=Rhodocytophaga aerolata TaxID=455078 RepID=A0ABT8RDT0_9BACT|nr:DUF1330 domain-containing protein [Rhodocytophaga aerolata]MDO1450261.1 DUF1330 domain-containing protein [Rhodocytophaga aerolata]